MTAALTVVNAGVRVAGKQILDGISFAVQPGEMVAIIGPNGAGKSTLLGALAGDHPYSGSITIADREVRGCTHKHLAKQRAVLRQHNTVSFPFSVLDVVKMGRAPWRTESTVEEDDRIIAQELLRTDTFQFAERTYTSLSGGEQARVSLARALVQRTPLLLLDEPTAALDVNYQEQVLAIARWYARQGNAVVVVMHDLAAAGAYADRVLLLAGGGMRAWGTPQEVLRRDTISEVYRHPVRVFEESEELVIIPVRFADEPVSVQKRSSQ